MGKIKKTGLTVSLFPFPTKSLFYNTGYPVVLFKIYLLSVYETNVHTGNLTVFTVGQ